MGIADRILKSKFLIAPVVLIAVSTIYFYTHRDHGPKSSDEFFERNSHLTRAASKLSDPLPLRKDDQFLENDYQLKSGTTYRIQVKNEVKLQGANRELLDTSYSGELMLHSLGMQSRKLILLAEFRIAELKGAGKMTPSASTQLGMSKSGDAEFLQRTFLVSLDPSGVIDKISAASRTVDDSATELKTNLLLTLFRRIPVLRPGTLIRREPDAQGNAFPIEYIISPVKDDQINVSAKVDLRQSLGANPNQAAAAGAPDLSLAGLSNAQKQSFDFVWIESAHVPKTQAFAGQSAISQLGKSLTQSEMSMRANWSAGLPSNLKDASIDAFKYPLDFKRYGKLSTGRIKSFQKIAKKDLLGRGMSQIQKELDLVDSSEQSGKKNAGLSDAAKDQLFLEYSNAVRDDPSLIPQVMSAALNAVPGSRVRSMAIGALGYEGSPAAQAAMVTIFENPKTTPDEKQKVVTELALSSEALSAESKTFLTQQYQRQNPLTSDLASTSGLALGASIARDGDVQTIQFLKSEWSDQGSAFGSSALQNEKKAYLLAAMGNSKSDAFADQVGEALGSKNNILRAGAVGSLRFAQDENSRQKLLGALANDPSSEVRTEAAQSLRYQPFDEKTQTALHACTQSSDVGVKIECYRVLTSRIQNPGVRDFLQSKVGGESDPQVSALLNQALQLKEESK